MKGFIADKVINPFADLGRKRIPATSCVKKTKKHNIKYYFYGKLLVFCTEKS